MIATPAPRGAGTGNRVTALRWAARLRSLGCRVRVVERWDGEAADALIALHAVKSADSARAFHAAHPGRPLIVGLAGTDVYGAAGRPAPGALETLALATRIVALQPLAIEALPLDLRARARTIFQSAIPPAHREPPRSGAFEVAVIANLRTVKDPLLAARASRLLPPRSRVIVLHAGAALEPALGAAAAAEAGANPRWRWLGPLPRAAALALIARCRLVLLTSRSEGGAGVIAEAAACGVPVAATRVAGNVGMLGADWPALFPPGDAAGLAALLRRAETDPEFAAELARRTAALAPRFAPAAERAAWAALLGELR